MANTADKRIEEKKLKVLEARRNHFIFEMEKLKNSSDPNFYERHCELQRAVGNVQAQIAASEARLEHKWVGNAKTYSVGLETTLRKRVTQRV